MKSLMTTGLSKRNRTNLQILQNLQKLIALVGQSECLKRKYALEFCCIGSRYWGGML